MSFWDMRAFLSGLESHLLGKSNKKRRKRGETVIEWFLYTRWRDLIPLRFLIMYFFIIITHSIAIGLCVYLHFVDHGYIITTYIIHSILYFDCLYGLILHFRYAWPSRSYKYNKFKKKKIYSINSKKYNKERYLVAPKNHREAKKLVKKLRFKNEKELKKVFVGNNFNSFHLFRFHPSGKIILIDEKSETEIITDWYIKFY